MAHAFSNGRRPGFRPLNRLQYGKHAHVCNPVTGSTHAAAQMTPEKADRGKKQRRRHSSFGAEQEPPDVASSLSRLSNGDSRSRASRRCRSRIAKRKPYLASGDSYPRSRPKARGGDLPDPSAGTTHAAIAAQAFALRARPSRRQPRLPHHPRVKKTTTTNAQAGDTANGGSEAAQVRTDRTRTKPPENARTRR